MKKVLIFFSVLIAAILIAIAALVMFVNPNQFKPLIIEQAKAQTGFDLVIDGDISWSFFPHLGFEIGKTQVLNPAKGFKQAQVVKIDQAALDISVLPLFDKELNIGNVTLTGADIFIQKLNNGQSNLDIVQQSVQDKAIEQDKEQTSDQEQSTSTTTASPWNITLAGITVDNAQLVMLDDESGSNLTLSDVNFSLSQFSFNEWSKAEFDITGQQNKQSFSASGKTEFKISQDLSDYQLRGTELEGQFSDPATNIKKATLVLESFQFNSVSKMALTVNGTVSGMDVDVKQSASIMLDKAMTKLKVQNISVTGNIEGKALPLSPINLDVASDISFDLEKQYLEVVLKQLAINELLFDGTAQLSLAPSIPKVVFELHSPEINVDTLLGQMETTSKQPEEENKTATQESNSTPTAQVEPDLSATRSLDVTGAITIDKLTASNAKLQNVQTQFKVNRGLIDLQKFSANLYEGSINANAKIDARKDVASYTVHKSLKGIQVQPLLKDVADMDFVSGSGNITADIKGKSLITDKAKKNLSGVIKVNFADGAFYGVNVAHEIRSVQAIFNGKKAEKESVKKTDFSAVTATMKLSKGVMKTDDLSAQSPLLRILGSGQANYVNETVDFLVKTSVVGSLKGQGGEDTAELNDITLPISIEGTWAEPKIRPDLNAALDEQTKQKAKEKIEEAKAKAQKEVDRGIDKLLGDKDSDKNDDVKKAAGDLLNNLFN